MSDERNIIRFQDMVIILQDMAIDAYKRGDVEVAESAMEKIRNIREIIEELESRMDTMMKIPIQKVGWRMRKRVKWPVKLLVKK